MKLFALALLTLGFVGRTVAGPTEDVLAAAVKVMDAPNYAWTYTLMQDTRSETLEGKSDHSGVSIVTMPMAPIVARMLGFPERDSEQSLLAIFKGGDNCVIKTASGWKKPGDITGSLERGRDSSSGSIPGSFGGMRHRRANGSGRGATLALDFSINPPSDEIAIIVANYTELKVDGATVTGKLSEEGAKLLLVRPGQKDLVPRTATATFKLWLKDGKLESYEIEVEGTFTKIGDSEKNERPSRQTITVQIKDVGKTTVEVPEEAMKALGK